MQNDWVKLGEAVELLRSIEPGLYKGLLREKTVRGDYKHFPHLTRYQRAANCGIWMKRSEIEEAIRAKEEARMNKPVALPPTNLIEECEARGYHKSARSLARMFVPV